MRRHRFAAMSETLAENLLWDSTTEDASLTGIARLFERARIKRAPVVRAGILVGIVSRTNLLQALMIDRRCTRRLCSREDRKIRDAFLTRLPQQPGLRRYPVNVIVSDGVVYLRGTVTSTVEAACIRRAAETTPGVRAVEDYLVPATPCRQAKG